MADLVTYLVADLDPETRPDWTGPVPAVLQAAVDAAAAAHGGRRAAGRPGEGHVAVFDAAAGAVAAAAAVAAERDLAGHVRVALHAGLPANGDHASPALRRAQRVREIASGGQVVLSSRAASLAQDALPAGTVLHDRGVHRLLDLSSPERVFELRSRDAAAPARPLRSLDAAAHNLPLQLSTFVGRRDELVALHRLLAYERLVTLVGPGGSGKTRLAAHALAEQAASRPDGAWWVELGELTRPDQVAEAVAAAVGVLVEPVQGPLASLARQLREARLVVCLDNCEHLLGAAAEVARTLLAACAEVTVVATSREPLGVPGEAVWAVPPLSGHDALWLLAERGGEPPDRDEDVAALRRICARLDGMPLALELAAAWLRTLTPGEIEAALEDRLALLVRGPRDAAERQRTLAASITWSYQLLDAPDRALLRSLAVFPAGFDLAAARAVAPDRAAALDALRRLVDKSLLVADRRDGATRYRLLESIRAYAAARLEEAGEERAARDRHLDHFLALAEGAEPLLDTDKDRWRLLVQEEAANLQAALQWGLEQPDPARGRRLAAALPWLWHLDRHGPVGLELLRRAVLLAPADRSLLQGRLLMGIALVADTAAPLGLEYDAAQQALEIANEHGDQRLRAMALGLAAVGRFYTDPDEAFRLAGQSIRAAEIAGEPLMLAASPGLQAIILHLRDRHDEADPMFTASTDALLRRGDRGVAASLLTFQALGALETGNGDRARTLAARAVEVAEPLGDYHRVGMARSTLALVLGATGDPEAGRRVLAPVATLVEGAGREVFVPGLGRAVGTLALWQGELDVAEAWLAGESSWGASPAGTYVEAQALPALAATFRRLGRHADARAAAERALALARGLRLPRTEADALDEVAQVAEPDRALELHHEALAVRLERGLRGTYASSLEALAALAATGGQADHATRLLAAADRARRELGRLRPPVERAEHDALVAALRAEEGFAAAWSAGAALTPEEATSYARRSRGSRDRPAAGWASLTAAERDVVALAVEGLSNPEIGARLFMSRHTVKTHLSHVYAKLGVANRTELAAAAGARADQSR